MIQTIDFKGVKYPDFQAKGNAAQFAIPFAAHVCKGVGYDIGCNRKSWSLPGSIPIDPEINTDHHAMNLPDIQVDYIFSSHCLEHVSDWVRVLDYWYEKLLPTGVLFLYLPDFSQEYWRPWNNVKHLHCFTPEIMKSYFESKGFKKVFCSGIDLNSSFMIMGEK